MPDPLGPRLGVDLGQARIGLAISDQGGVFAAPLMALERATGKPPKLALADDLAALAGVVEEHRIALVVVGWPRNLKGEAARAARTAEEFVERLRAAVAPVPVRLVDERVTTLLAHRQLREAGVSGKRLVRKGQRGVVDQLAATAILQGWLDGPGREETQGSGRE
ncbi:Holliday junction resolvase RuvX [Segniliparus rugosus]|uniref:Putative pre-16S rRNA nuclease n=1 Tax=Segniliparus rugosus (strain ATCC BAA-974 / DSM 45345 / CCUG 50838 / CIP 108380 / JCM 13579 / CDC 945) TaxID=679197 RepID=E5XP46_SEGRC|nr:Holliday junction resolvase RuvX [Segniliparus rugosus]EFV13869.1 RNAse H-fold protein YqgF [Segniliparus rugosus ATCC BAA-974]